ncbi:DNA methylase [Lachnospiraceae bacterium C1.1]|nr:DNA methylase [Lachnospiraceae bacterium C1.1]
MAIIGKKFSESKIYIAVDMKSFYASVECVSRGMNPLTTNLLVADNTRTDKTICLAVSPSLKAIGVPSRPRLFEAKTAIEKYEKSHNTKMNYITAVPRMSLYESVSAQIYSIILRYAAPEDVHVYSIDESFIDATPYLHLYRDKAEELGIHPAHLMAMNMIREVLKKTGITATVGIGTNLYLAKVAMDIVAKKALPDKDGVRIAELNEDSYKFLLWNHEPITDFWMIGAGKALRLQKACLTTMGDIAEKSQWDEEWFYKKFGIDGEIMIAHAWGEDPVGIYDIKNYHTDNHSLSNGQVLPRPYKYGEARNVFSEMVDNLCEEMFAKAVVAPKFSWWVSYDYKSLEEFPLYDGEVVKDYYGRLHPKHSNGTVRMSTDTNSGIIILPRLLESFDAKTDHRLLYRRLGVCAESVVSDEGYYQLSFLTDYKKLERERRLKRAVMELRSKYGANVLFKGKNMLEGATQLERNRQIGGHLA